MEKCDYSKTPDTMIMGAPGLKEFKTVEECKRWCVGNPECMAVVRSIDGGEMGCKYYKYDKNIGYVKDVNSNIYKRRRDIYVNEPDKDKLPRYDPLGEEKGDPYLGCGPYGCCADGSKKADADGSNCRPFTKESGLVGDPVERYQYNSLNGVTKMGGLQNFSGDSYIMEGFDEGNRMNVYLWVVILLIAIIFMWKIVGKMVL